MASDLDARIKVGADTREAEAGIDRVNSKVASMGDSASKAGERAGAAFDGMGKSSDGAATKIDKSTQGIIRSIEREVAALEAGGKSTAAYYENIAKQRGADMNALAPYLQQMQLAEKQAQQALGSMGISAKQTAAAMRGVPAQFTDIFVSLQGGQAPLTVFLQQGGQLKDMFGGAGSAAKALGSYVLGLFSPLTIAGAAVAALGLAYYQGSKEQDAFVKAIVLTGNASGMTTSQLHEYARQIDAVVGTQAQAAAGLAAFTAAGVQGGDELRRYTQTAIEWERATGQAVEKTAEQFASLQKDPLAAVLKLNEGTNFLTTSVYEQIKALEEQGKKTEAAEVAMNALDDTMRERAKAIEESLGYIERAWRKIKEEALGAWDAMAKVGRPETNEDHLERLRTQIANKEQGLGSYWTDRSRKIVEDEIEGLRAQEWALLDVINAEHANAAAKKESARQTQSLIDFDKKWSKALEGEKTLQDKLTAARNEAVAAGKSEADIKTVLAFVTEEHNKGIKKAKGGTKAYNKELSDQKKLIGELSGLASTFYKDWERLNKMYAQGRLSLSELEKEQSKLLAKQPFAIALAKEEAEAAKALQKAIDDDIKAFERLGQQRENSIKSAQDAVQKALEEEQAYAVAASANITLAEAKERITLARLNEHLAMAREGAESQQTIDRLEREIAAHERMLEVMAQKGTREANKKAQDQITKDWEKLSQTVGRTLADYIMGGGKDAAQYLKRLFATLVLEPVVQYGVQSLMGGLGGAGASGGANLLGGLQSGQSLWSAFSGGTSGTLAAGVSSLGSLMGSSFLGELGAGIAAGGQLGIGGAASLLGSAGGTTGFGMAIGAAAPWIAGAAALIGLISKFDDSGTPHMGGSAMWSAATGGKTNLDLLNTSKTDNPLSNIDNQFGSGFGWVEDRAEVRDVLGVLAQGMGSSLDSFAKSFGSAFGYEVALGFADDTSKDGSWGALRISQGGNDIVNWNDNRESKWAPRSFSDGEEGYKQYLNAVFLDYKTALLGMDLPAWADQILDASSDIDTINAALQQIGATRLIFDQLGQSMQMFSGISGDLQTQLLMASGGIESLSANAGTFYQGFFDESERMEALNQQLRDALSGLDLSIDPAMGEAAKRQYREAVEAAMAGGQGELAAQLLAMSGTFATAADAAQKSLSDMADAALESAAAAEALSQNLRSSLTSLEAQFSGGGFARQYQAEDAAKTVQQLLGDVGISKDLGVLTQTLLSATSADVESYFREIWNVLPTDDAKQQLVEVAGSMLDLAAAAEAAAQAVAAERESLEQRWLQAIGDTAELRRLELEALDPSNRALLEMIYGLEDAKAGMNELANAAQAAAQTAAAAWQNWGTASSLVAQYLGDTSGLQARQAILNAQIAASTDPATRLSKLQELISIEQAIASAQQTASKSELEAINARQQALQKEISAAQKLLSAAQALGSYVDQLQTSAASGLSDQDRLSALGGQYSQLLGRARGGDADAMANLQGVSGSYLSLAQEMAVSSADYSVLSGRMAAELEAIAATGQASATSAIQQYENQMAQLTAQSDLLTAQVELSDSTKSLIAKSMLDQAEVWDRENTNALNLQDIQQLAADRLALMPDNIAKSLRPTLDGNATYLAGSIGGTVANAINNLAGLLGLTGSGSTPGFASGGLHAGGLRIVGERGWELEATGPSRIWNQQQLAGVLSGGGNSNGNAEVVAQLRELNRRIERLESHAARTADSAGGLYDLTDQKSEGGNADRVEMMNVREMAQAIAQAIKEPIKETA